MKNFADFIKETYDIEMPKGNIESSWFMQNHIPMIVRCCCCDMTMASPSAWIDDQGYTYCGDCADPDETQLSMFDDPFGVPDDYNEGWQ